MESLDNKLTVPRLNPFVAIIVAILLFLLVGLIVQLIWNAVLPEVIGVGKLTYIQALLLVILVRVLFLPITAICVN